MSGATDVRDAAVQPGSPSTESVGAVIERLMRRVPDFPRPGVEFIDLTTVFADRAGFAAVVEGLTAGYQPGEIDIVAGLDARGFLLAAAVALRLDTGVLAIRKAGKLPPPVHACSYQLEYGDATLEIPAEGLDLQGARVLVVDDVLATGGTLGAAIDLLERCGSEVKELSVVLEVPGLGGRDKLAGTPLTTLTVA